MITDALHLGDLLIAETDGQINAGNDSWYYLCFSINNMRIDVPKGTLILLLGFKQNPNQNRMLILLVGDRVVARYSTDFMTKL
jgi:hypothetical protein